MKKISKIFISLLFPLLLLAVSHHDWTYNQNIYEVNVRQYTESGTFDEFSEHLDRLQEMGVGILWFMPVHPIGEENRLGSLGSYYSVKDYYGINPEFGTMTDFKELLEEIHDHGMYVIIDWVANHTAWDNELTNTHPEWYIKDGNGNFIPPLGTNWSDVIDLDYSKQGLRDYMIEAMKFWLDEIGVDGFRYDAVDMVPMDFWEAAISDLKSHKPDLFMLAEGEGKHLEEVGFDMTYCWGLHAFGNGVLKDIVNDSKNANDLAAFLANEAASYSQEHYRMYFTSNHDENSWSGTVFENFGEAAECFAVLTQVLDGTPLIYSGQEVGLDKRLAFFDKDQIPWQSHPFEELYTKLLHLKRSNSALWNGNAGGDITRISTTSNSAVIAFTREKNNCKILGIMNLSPQNQVPIFLSPTIAGDYVDVFSGDSITFQQGSNMNLGKWEYKVYETTISGTRLDDLLIPKEFSLVQNYPNPFNPSTTIRYSLPQKSAVKLTVYDLVGKIVKELVSSSQPEGNYQVNFNAENLSSGIYFYCLKAGDFHQTKQMLLIK